MLDRQHGKIVFECDTCGDTLDTEEGDFNDARAVFTAAGWHSNKAGDLWLHACHDCTRKAALRGAAE